MIRKETKETEVVRVSKNRDVVWIRVFNVMFRFEIKNGRLSSRRESSGWVPPNSLKKATNQAYAILNESRTPKK